MIKTRKLTPLWGIIVSLSACSLHEETMFSRVVDDYQDEPQKVKAVEYLEKSINYQHGTARHFVDSLGNIATGLNPAEHKTDSAYRAYIDSRDIHLQAHYGDMTRKARRKNHTGKKSKTNTPPYTIASASSCHASRY